MDPKSQSGASGETRYCSSAIDLMAVLRSCSHSLVSAKGSLSAREQGIERTGGTFGEPLT